MSRRKVFPRLVRLSHSLTDAPIFRPQSGLKICRFAAQTPAWQAFCGHSIPYEGAAPPRTPPAIRKTSSSIVGPDRHKMSRRKVFLRLIGRHNTPLFNRGAVCSRARKDSDFPALRRRTDSPPGSSTAPYRDFSRKQKSSFHSFSLNSRLL